MHLVILGLQEWVHFFFQNNGLSLGELVGLAFNESVSGIEEVIIGRGRGGFRHDCFRLVLLGLRICDSVLDLELASHGSAVFFVLSKESVDHVAKGRILVAELIVEVALVAVHNLLVDCSVWVVDVLD